MPPKFKFSKNEVIQAALTVIREHGQSGLTARALASELGCSVKPIFGLFNNMEQLQQEVWDAANSLYHEYLREDMTSNKYPEYKASGMAYIRFAKEETELFKLLFMCDRTQKEQEAQEREIEPFIKLIQKNLGITEENAYLFHLEMWIYVHGIATMIATSYLKWDMEFVSKILTDAYLGLKNQYCTEEKNSGCDKDNRINKEI